MKLTSSSIKKIPIPDDWFSVYRIKPDLYVIHEPHHYEQNLISLIIAEKNAVLIDTGCGIGDLKSVVRQVTDKPILVINTHTHTDHIGGNRQFGNIAMFKHPNAWGVVKNGVSHEVMAAEILAPELVSAPWPEDFDPEGFSLPPFIVSRWLEDKDLILLEDRDFLVIHTPGEALDHICLLDRSNRILFCGDILVNGAVWTHLDGGSLKDLIKTYNHLLTFIDDFDYLMPSHNTPWIDKYLLYECLDGAGHVLAGDASFNRITDPWNRNLREYTFDRFQILTRDNDHT